MSHTTAMNAKISVFVIYVEAIIYLLLYNLHDGIFKSTVMQIEKALINDRLYVSKVSAFQLHTLLISNTVISNTRLKLAKN